MLMLPLLKPQKCYAIFQGLRLLSPLIKRNFRLFHWVPVFFNLIYSGNGSNNFLIFWTHYSKMQSRDLNLDIITYLQCGRTYGHAKKHRHIQKHKFHPINSTLFHNFGFGCGLGFNNPQETLQQPAWFDFKHNRQSSWAFKLGLKMWFIITGGLTSDPCISSVIISDEFEE